MVLPLSLIRRDEMAQILVCDQCGAQVPDPGSAGVKDWLVLRRSDFRGNSLSFCSTGCLLRHADDRHMEALEAERVRQEELGKSKEDILEDLISGKLQMP
jgi:hypothetical protein